MNTMELFRYIARLALEDGMPYRELRDALRLEAVGCVESMPVKARLDPDDGITAAEPDRRNLCVSG